MKRLTTLSTIIAAMMAAPTVSADTLLGVYVGGHVWDMSTEGGISDSDNLLDFDYSTEKQNTMYIALEHFIPLVPNLKVRQSEMKTSGQVNSSLEYTFNGETFAADSTLASSFDVTSTDFVLYYEILDFDAASFDVGLNVKYLDGTVSLASVDDAQQADPFEFKGPVPMLYGKVEVGLPFTGLGAFAEVNTLSLDGQSVYDYQAAVVYEFLDNLAVDAEVQVGYRAVGLDLDDLDGTYSDLEFNGLYAGIQLHF